MENKRKHLEFIQAAVSRMSSNLFLLKGWTITLIAALFALAQKDSNQLFALIAYIPAIMFWILDGYFLCQERRFRALYDTVRQKDEASIDFSMDTSPYRHNHTWPSAIFSPTLSVYYGSLIVLMLIVMFFLI